MDINTIIADKILTYIANDPLSVHIVQTESKINYTNIINMWSYFKSTNEKYAIKFDDIILKSRQLSKDKIDAYGYEYKKYPLLNDIFESIILRETDSMIIFYIKSSDEFLVFLRSDQMWLDWTNVKEIGLLEKMTRIIHSPIWLMSLSLPEIRETFNNYFMGKQHIEDSVCVFIY